MRKFINIINENTNYMREIPRDFFNEGDLLNNLGKFVINLERCQGDFEFDWDHDAFSVGQNEDDGSIYVQNVYFSVRGNPVSLVRPLNSREKWPLRLIDEETWETINVFDRSGNFTQEMIDYLKGEGDGVSDEG